MSASTTAENDAEDVNDFLRRIQELGKKRDEEDEERNRKLEEEILQGRRERQARRAERARSISPSKGYSLATPPSLRSSPANLSPMNAPSTFAAKPSPVLKPPIISSGIDFEVSAAVGTLTGDSTVTPSKITPSKKNMTPAYEPEGSASGGTDATPSTLEPMKPSPSSGVPTRSGTLSWQQRRPPDRSQASERGRDRPLSMIATENATRSPGATTDSASPLNDKQPHLTRDQIALSLGSKDPSWFRQTADRGRSSPALRKSQVEDDNVMEHGQGIIRQQLPGMEQKQSEEIAQDQYDGPSPSTRTDPTRSDFRGSDDVTAHKVGLVGSPVPMTKAQTFAPLSISPQREPSDDAVVSGSPAGILPERLSRPSSPTKGLGGFVQSAMMKRSDSINKRWSVQSPTGLYRAGSVASNRSSIDMGSAMSSPRSRTQKPSILSFDGFERPDSQSPSSQRYSTPQRESNRSTTASSIQRNLEGSITPEQTRPSPSVDVANSPDVSITPRRGLTSVRSGSPAGMSGRRSPTKSSWLETALNKPETPKLKPRAAPVQPAWMAEINKAKQRGSGEAAPARLPEHKHIVNIGGLMRSPAMGETVTSNKTGKAAGDAPAPTSLRQNIAQNDADSGSAIDITSSDARKVSKSKPPVPVATKPLRTPSAATNTLLVKSQSNTPITPPTKDFRGSLKPRQPLPEANGKKEPEFKQLRDQLRGTKTQNYVAPDVLKSNILRGKAELTTTDGPVKAEQKDDFKEAILEKKNVFRQTQAGGNGVQRSPSVEKQSSPLPEALAKAASVRNGTMTGGSGRTRSASKGRLDSPLVPEALVRAAIVRRSSTAMKLAIATGCMEAPIPQNEMLKSDVELDQNSTSFIQHAKLQHETSSPARLQTTTSAVPDLASRFNPALATLLARRPPNSDGSSQTASLKVSTMEESKASSNQTSAPGPELTHMTKARARGPRRKAPTASIKQDVQPSEGKKELRSESSTTIPSDIRRDSSVNVQQTSAEAVSAKAFKSVLASEAAEPAGFEGHTVLSDGSEHSTKDTPSKVDASRSGVPSKLALHRRSIFLTGSQVSQPQLTPIKIRSRSTSPVKEASAALEKLNTSSAEAVSPRPVQPRNHQSPNSSREGRPPALKIAKPALSPKPDIVSPRSSPGLSNANKPLGAGDNKTSDPKPARAVSSPAKKPSTMITDFFGINGPVSPYDIDTAAILTKKPSRPKPVKSLASQLYNLSTTTGKMSRIPDHEERVLFECDLYICIHTFEDGAGTKSKEMYFWAGDDVSDADVENAQEFAEQEAKKANALLIITWQGKETSNFIQALGGMLIIRRGTRSKYDSLAPCMLCGRSYVGQIVFDEIDLATASLCSGFSYLVVTEKGKCYLWKGRGTSVDELSCARMLGMELDLMGEVVEVDEGQETGGFLQTFGSAAKVNKSADHWKLKPNYAGYGSRLFCAAAEGGSSKAQITELSPFTQRSISSSKIYILDAFFEIYILVGSAAQSQYRAFCQALSFAQEYGILAAGIEDRPFVPVSTVVLEGTPRDLKSCFRKWKIEATSASASSPMAPSTLGRGRSLRVVTLNAALSALDD